MLIILSVILFQVCRNINQIMICMETGRTVILLNLDNLYESLYDLLNQVSVTTIVLYTISCNYLLSITLCLAVTDMWTLDYKLIVSNVVYIKTLSECFSSLLVFNLIFSVQTHSDC